MSDQITTAFVQQYSTNVAMLLQQRGSKLREAVVTFPLLGKAASVLEQFGYVTPVRNMSRHSDTPLISTPQDRRWAYPEDWDWADLIDDQDKLRMLIDPTSPYVQAGAFAMGRAIDDESIAGFFGSNNTGQVGNIPTGLLSAYNSGSQVVPVTVGSANPTGLNISKLRAAKKMLMAAEVDIDNEQLFVAITAEQHDNLLNETQAISLDYNTKPVLVDGKISSFMGFNFIHSERIPGGAGFNKALNPALTGYTEGATYLLPFWARSGVALGVWNDVKAQIDRRPDKRNSWQVYVTGTFGGTRLEEKRCGIITCAVS
jgi:hypothetical protein